MADQLLPDGKAWEHPGKTPRRTYPSIYPKRVWELAQPVIPAAKTSLLGIE